MLPPETTRGRTSTTRLIIEWFEMLANYPITKQEEKC